MDNVKAKQLYSVDIGQPVKYATNTADAKIYIADAKGRIACLEPAQVTACRYLVMTLKGDIQNGCENQNRSD